MSTGRIGLRASTCCVFVGILAACSGAPAPEPARTVTTTVVPSATGSVSGSTSSSTTADIETIAVDVYRAMWADWIEAAETSNYQSPRLADHAASRALLLVSGSLQRAHERNIVAKGEPSLAPRVTGTTPPSSPVAVSISDCVDATRWLNYTRDGRLQNQTPGGKHQVTATVGLVDGRWMVTRLTIGEVGSCP